MDPSCTGGAPALRALAAHALQEVGRGHGFPEANAHRFVWSTFPDPVAHTAERTASARAFGDGAFDLVLSSHLLSTYDDRFDGAWHVAALTELLRGATSRVVDVDDELQRGGTRMLVLERTA